MRFRPSPALVVAAFALLISLGGTGYAATQLLPRNSVASPQVVDRSLLAKDFRRGQLPSGPPGQPGAPGPGGPAGPAGIAQISDVAGPAAGQCANGGGECQVATSTATCPAGTISVGGGYVTGTPLDVVAFARRGPAASQFTVIAANFWNTGSSVTALATCAAGPGVSAANTASKEAIAKAAANLVQSLK
jgi:hypothetical protein